MTATAAPAPTKRMGRPVTRVSTVLINARKHVAKRMVRGCLKRGGGYCSLGAVMVESGIEIPEGSSWPTERRENALYRGAVGRLAEVWEPEAAPKYGDLDTLETFVFLGHDNTSTSKKTVLAKFDEAIQIARRSERRRTTRKATATA